MLKKFKDFITTSYLNDSFSLDYRIYIIFFIVSYFVTLIATFTNTMLYSALITLLPQWLYLFVCTFLLFASTETRMRFQKIQLLFSCLVYIPFIYFQTNGYDGTALLFSIIGMFVLTLVFSGIPRIIIILINMAITIGCVIINHYYPSLVIPHDSLESKLIDFIISLVLSLGCMAIMTIQITQAYQRKNDELAEITLRDSLTGIYNRRFLFHYLEQILTQQPKQRVCALMMDLDHFKQINDTYGHGFGDEVLVSFTHAVQTVLRDSDILARYGGEEFVTLLHNVSIDSALVIAERIRLAISEVTLTHDLQITVSIGVAMAKPGDSPESLLSVADKYLYQAKENGRNQICHAGSNH